MFEVIAVMVFVALVSYVIYLTDLRRFLENEIVLGLETHNRHIISQQTTYEARIADLVSELSEAKQLHSCLGQCKVSK